MGAAAEDQPLSVCRSHVGTATPKFNDYPGYALQDGARMQCRCGPAAKRRGVRALTFRTNDENQIAPLILLGLLSSQLLYPPDELLALQHLEELGVLEVAMLIAPPSG